MNTATITQESILTKNNINEAPLQCKTQKRDISDKALLQKNMQRSTKKNKTNSTPESSTWTVKQTHQNSSFVPTLGVFILLGWNGIIMCLIFYGYFFATFLQRAIIVSLSTLSLVLPGSFPGQLGVLFGNWMVTQAAKYFGLKTVIENENALADIKDKAAIFATEPHDILPYYVFAFSPKLGQLPGHHGKEFAALVSSALFSIPFMRQIYTWARLGPIDKKTFKDRLENCESFTFVPGGIQEVTFMGEAKEDEIVLFLKKRKGFVKLALETGSPIVPVYCFGVKGSYGHWIPKGQMMSKIGRAIGFLPCVIWGRYGIPFGIPKPHQITVVIGEPIDIPLKGGKVSSEMIEKYHSLYLAELEGLFERHKRDHGYGNMKLKIV